MTEQSKIAETPDTLSTGEQQTVYAVVVRYMDSPHPDCVGVYTDEADAQQKRRDCEDSFTEPKPVVAWEVCEVELK